MTEPIETAPELVLVLTTFPDVAVGEHVVGQLVQERLIACGNLLPGVTSLFRWDAKLQREDEVLVLMKTPRSVVERLFQRITELHPYEVPELVSLSADAVSAAYCRWVRQETIEVTA